MSYQLEIDDLTLTITPKAIRTIRLRITRPDGEIEVSVPRLFPRGRLVELLMEKLPWMRQKQAEARDRPIPAAPEYQTGESHPFLGLSYPLIVLHRPGPVRVDFDPTQGFMMQAAADSDSRSRMQAMDEWYRQALRNHLADLMPHWEGVIRQSASSWQIKKMKSRWGSCNPHSRKISFSLALAKYPLTAIEYVVVHELVHLIEPSHNSRFKALMTQFLPDWPLRRASLR